VSDSLEEGVVRLYDVRATKAQAIDPQQDGQDVGVFLCWWQLPSELCDELGEYGDACANLAAVSHHPIECIVKDNATMTARIVFISGTTVLVFNRTEPRRATM